jgi:hypothetical protein
MTTRSRTRNRTQDEDEDDDEGKGEGEGEGEDEVGLPSRPARSWCKCQPAPSVQRLLVDRWHWNR